MVVSLSPKLLNSTSPYTRAMGEKEGGGEGRGGEGREGRGGGEGRGGEGRGGEGRGGEGRGGELMKKREGAEVLSSLKFPGPINQLLFHNVQNSCRSLHHFAPYQGRRKRGGRGGPGRPTFQDNFFFFPPAFQLRGWARARRVML